MSVNPNPKPDSRRSKRRAKRNFKETRLQRRAKNRLAVAMGGFNLIASQPDANKPGAMHAH